MKRILSVLGLFAATVALADENSDLDLIPKSVSEQKAPANPEPASRWSSKILIEEAATSWETRRGLAIPPPTALPNWQSVTSFDGQIEFKASRVLHFRLSDRLNAILQDDITFPNQANLRNDWREFSAHLELAGGNFFFQVGRINTRTGVALGFNPTDFFKPRTAVLQSSIDPSSTRENRLGVLQIGAQAVFEKASFNLIAAPGLATAAPLGRSEPSFSPRLGETNSENRFLATASLELLDLSPQFLLFHDNQGERWGLNLSHGIGSSLVLYGEWAGGKVAPLASRALQFALDTGTLPPLFPVQREEKFQSDAALGASWSSSSKFTINLEYHFHQSGLPNDELKDWLERGQANPLLGQQLWLIRQYAGDQQEPLTQKQIFLRLAVPDFIWNRHELDAVGFINPDDGSTTAQLSSLYLINDDWNLNLYWTTLFGSGASEKGTLPFQNVLAAKLGRYF